MGELERNTYFLDEVLLKQNVEKSIHTEISLPDYCPDIGTCLECFAFINVVSGSYNETNINVEGNVLLRILYVSEGEIFSYEKSEPFSAQTEHGCECLGAVLEISSFLQYVNCRAVNPRKFEISGSFIIQAVLSRCSDIAVADMAGKEKVEMNRETIIACSAGGKTGDVIRLEQVLDIGNHKPEIKSIIRTSAIPIIEQTKQVSGKVLIKGELKLRTLYKSQASTVETIENSIALSKIIELPGVDEESTLDIKLSLHSLEVEVKPGALGNMSLLDIRAGVGILASCYNCVDFPIISDAYSTTCESECSFENVCVDRIVEKIDKSLMHTVSIANISDIKRIIDIWCDQIQCRANLQGDNLVFSGNFELYILYENGAGQITFKHSREKYSFTHATDTLESLICEPNVHILGTDYMFNNESLNVRVNIGVSAVVLERMCKRIVADIAIGDEALKNTSGLHIVYARKGEELWDIAKRYKTSVRKLQSDNKLDENALAEDKKLFIWS